METTTKFKEVNTLENVITNYNKYLAEIADVVDKHNYVVKVNSDEVSSNFLRALKPDFEKLTWTGRKKVLKRLWNVSKKNSRNNMNLLFRTLLSLGVVSHKIYIQPSHDEQKIIAARKEYKNLAKLTQAAMLKYKEAKGDFYKK